MHNCIHVAADGGSVLPPSLAGRRSHFEIIACDYFCNRRSVGGDPFTVHLKGPMEYDCDVVDNGNGTYTVWYGPTLAGQYTFFCLLHEQQVKSLRFAHPDDNQSCCLNPTKFCEKSMR